MILTHIGLVPGLSSGDEINLVATVFIGFTLAGVLWYAREAQKQARATADIASVTFRPFIALWIQEKVIGNMVNPYTLKYRNIGSGPAMNLKFDREPPIGRWLQTPERVSMSTIDVEGELDLEFDGTVPESIVLPIRYQDAAGSWWTSRTTPTRVDGKLTNGDSTVERA